MRSENDDKPVLIDTLMRINRMQWSPNGSVLAFAGTQVRLRIGYYGVVRMQAG